MVWRRREHNAQSLLSWKGKASNGVFHLLFEKTIEDPIVRGGIDVGKDLVNIPRPHAPVPEGCGEVDLHVIHDAQRGRGGRKEVAVGVVDSEIVSQEVERDE
jgi:hypothetical protein